MKKILFRADAKPSIGTGDLISLIALSEYLDDFECFFLTQSTSAAKKIIERRNQKNVFWLDENADVKVDVATINEIVDSHKIDMLFFEITERKLTEYKGLKSEIPKVCVNFDGFVPDDIKVVINWDTAAVKYYDVGKFPDTKFLLGSKYVILPKPFYADEIKARTYATQRKKILIAMGGADELDFTSKVASAVAGVDRELVIIVGAGYENEQSLKNTLDSKVVKYEIKTNVADMLLEYLACDFAVGAGGLTSSELVASRTPCALIATYEHQIARCEYFGSNGWAKYLGFRDIDYGVLATAVDDFIPTFCNNIFETKAVADAIRAC